MPGAPLWLTALLLIAMTATNLFSVSPFGEFEYWFAGIKVGAIVVFLVIGSLYVRPVAAQEHGLLQPVDARRLLPARRQRGHRRRGDRHLLDGRSRDRDDRRRRVLRSPNVRWPRPPTP